ncbi:hypothetical protein LSTR_LSTR012453 [Laodelphax striatellus]|uniref:Uncharacterized protein n=1 Tax=Laodelphax striatellus TaxID=195883 RepID=A0A482XL60_LAOST|nr:hypothetical protein LSTR_LSTR012453 [Laodelphax striatellus]
MESNEHSSYRKGKIEQTIPRPPSRVRTTGRETVEFSVRGPLPVNIDEEPVTIPGAHSGPGVCGGGAGGAAAVVGESTFPQLLHRILSVLVRCAPTPEPQTGTSRLSQSCFRCFYFRWWWKWKLSIARKELDDAAARIWSTAAQSGVVWSPRAQSKWNSPAGHQLVLYGTTVPVWRVFHIEEFNVYADLPRLSLLKSDVANFTFNHHNSSTAQPAALRQNAQLVRRKLWPPSAGYPPNPSPNANAPPPPHLLPLPATSQSQGHLRL